MPPRRPQLAGCAWLLALVPLTALADAVPEVTVDAAKQEYRRIHVDVRHAAGPETTAYEVWFSDRPFRSTPDAELHSTVLIGDVSGLARTAPAFDTQDCWSGGLPIHRNADDLPVVARDAGAWSCSLSGMTPGADQWIAVVPVGANGRSTASFEPVMARTDVADERTPEPDTLHITVTLAAVVLAAVALLSYLRFRDVRGGRAGTRHAYVYVAPALIGLTALTFYPIAYGVWLAFTDASQSHLGQENWNGIGNFVTVAASPGILRVGAFTMIWTFTNVAAHVGIGLLLAYTLTRPGIRGSTLYRTVLLLPWAIPGYISVLAWNGMLQPDGLLNAILGTAIDFTATPNAARASVILVNIWLGIPFMMMALSGALQGIPTDMFEAAELEGASRWDQFVRLTLPNLKGTLVPISLLGFIWTFNTFNTIYLMTRGNPYVGFGEPGATDTLITYVFSVAFDYGQYGVAAAWSVALFLLLVGISYVYVKRSGVMELAR
ncbi:MAG: sugar ABC transporter permease [Gammaproteobacteria bacterium]|nr:sugar ABC transporter permease [Gammaproteobacteria bacterium]